ncbi:MAG: 50S ribosomal protein L4 [Lentisphaerae bacterium GWF2_44_16]|nr:MAG: 50S ribosomal protein L4 [Lentisphaerae bacterium GWF2_44_16]
MSKKLNILDSKGGTAGEFALDDKYIELEKGSQAVHDVIIAYLAGIRSGSACTKNRSEVRGGGAKPWRQKGTGRARAGSSRSPIWKGGGVSFGPKPRSYAKKINKKVRKLALKRAFNERLNENAVTVLDSLQLADCKTKNFMSVLNALKIEKSTLMLVRDYDENILRATANLPDFMLVKAETANVYQLIRFNNVIFTKDGLEAFLRRIE